MVRKRSQQGRHDFPHLLSKFYNICRAASIVLPYSDQTTGSLDILIIVGQFAAYVRRLFDQVFPNRDGEFGIPIGLGSALPVHVLA
jgi:hypothetical protein